MTRKHLIAIQTVLITLTVIGANASAYYHPTMGRFISRDPGAGANSAKKLSGFIPRDPTGSNQYSDGMNLYQYVTSEPIGLLDPQGLATTRYIEVFDRRPGMNDCANKKTMKYQIKDGCDDGACDIKQQEAISRIMAVAAHKIAYAAMDTRWKARPDAKDWRDSHAHEQAKIFNLVHDESPKANLHQLRELGERLIKFRDGMQNSWIELDIKCYDDYDQTRDLCKREGQVANTEQNLNNIGLCKPFFDKHRSFDDQVRTMIHELGHVYLHTVDAFENTDRVYISVVGGMDEDKDGKDTRKVIYKNYYYKDEPRHGSKPIPDAGYYQFQRHADTIAWYIDTWDI